MSRFVVLYLNHSVLPTSSQLLLSLALCAAAGAIGAAVLFVATGKIVERFTPDQEVTRRYLKRDALSYGLFLILLLQEAGLVIHKGVFALLLLVFLGAKPLLYYWSLPEARRRQFRDSREWLCCLFLLSGVAALVYQVTWQRILFRLFGVNSESITMIVSVFMFGLGLGALIGGRLSQGPTASLPRRFLFCELAIGIYGFVSVPLIQAVGEHVIHFSPFAIGLTAFALLLPPTLAMGATLPILVSYLNRSSGKIGESVGILYFFNTVGSALACVLTTNVLFIFLGQQAAVTAAALCNFLVGWLVSRHGKGTA